MEYHPVKENDEISGKVLKSLISPLPAGRQGLGTDCTDKKYIGKSRGSG